MCLGVWVIALPHGCQGDEQSPGRLVRGGRQIFWRTWPHTQMGSWSQCRSLLHVSSGVLGFSCQSSREKEGRGGEREKRWGWGGGGETAAPPMPGSSLAHFSSQELLQDARKWSSPSLPPAPGRSHRQMA